MDNNGEKAEFNSLPIRKEEYLLVREKQFELIKKRGKAVSLTDTVTEIIKKGMPLVVE